MISLIGNELKKIFKKKTIYILLIIIVGYMLLSNILIKATDDGYSYYYYYEGDIEYYQDYLSNLDSNNPADIPTYIDMQTQIELLELTREYGNKSWQAYVINNMMNSYVRTMVSYEYSDETTEDAYNAAKESYDTALEKLQADDWKYFVNADLEYINNSLEEQYQLRDNTQDKESLTGIEDTIYDLELQKQIDEWRLEKNISYAPSFLNDALNDYYEGQYALHQYEDRNINELSSEEYQNYQAVLETTNLNRYYIDNMISLDSNSRTSFLNLFNSYELFILIVGIVIAGSIVSEEFNRGTIKLLLVKPYNRIKILLSKFIVCMIILALTIAFIYVFQLICGGIINGFEDMTLPAIVYNFDTNRVESINIFAYVALIGVCKLPIYILLTTLAFACSTIFTNTALAVAVPFLGYIASSLINQFALLYDIKQIIYFVTPNWDLSVYLFGGAPLFDGLTLLFSIIICVIYLIIMLVISGVVFKKRDIKNI